MVSTANDATAKAPELHPDVVLMDRQLPDADGDGDGDGVTAMAEIKRLCPDTNVLMLTEPGEDYTFARRAFEAGCSGIVDRSRSVEELFAAVRAASTGKILIKPSMLQSLPVRGTLERGGNEYGVTRRELEVLAIIADGGSNNEIAEHLGISLGTARKHVQNIIGKLGAHSMLEALVIAAREGLVRPP